MTSPSVFVFPPQEKVAITMFDEVRYTYYFNLLFDSTLLVGFGVNTIMACDIQCAVARDSD